MVNVGNQRTSDQEVSIYKQYKMFCFCYTFTTRKLGKSTSAWEYLLPVLTYTTGA